MTASRNVLGTHLPKIMSRTEILGDRILLCWLMMRPFASASATTVVLLQLQYWERERKVRC